MQAVNPARQPEALSSVAAAARRAASERPEDPFEIHKGPITIAAPLKENQMGFPVCKGPKYLPVSFGGLFEAPYLCLCMETQPIILVSV